MIYPLPTPVAGQTHALVNYIEIRPGESICMGGVLGTANGDEFVPLEGFGGLSFGRAIVGEEYSAFVSHAEKAGVSLDVLAGVIAGWMDSTGLEKSRYAEVKAAEAATAEATP